MNLEIGRVLQILKQDFWKIYQQQPLNESQWNCPCDWNHDNFYNKIFENTKLQKQESQMFKLCTRCIYSQNIKLCGINSQSRELWDINAQSEICCFDN